MAQTILHKANSRGTADHGWLKSYHTFSFAGYYNPERIHFGALRVLNDDQVDGGRGFGEHPHDNMEIISIPLEGELMHKDSMGNEAVIQAGEIQAMSAGTGIYHAEYNKNQNEAVKFLQIWLFPKVRNVEPRYDQIKYDKEATHNQFLQVLSPNKEDQGVWIHQDAWFHLANFDLGFEADYQFKLKGNGAYIFVLKGDIEVNGQTLNTRDGYGIWEADEFNVKATNDAFFLIMEVPMLV
jgi:redox-sensitive bicupin YhaK (pirin superfamily)